MESLSYPASLYRWICAWGKKDYAHYMEKWWWGGDAGMWLGSGCTSVPTCSRTLSAAVEGLRSFHSTPMGPVSKLERPHKSPQDMEGGQMRPERGPVESGRAEGRTFSHHPFWLSPSPKGPSQPPTSLHSPSLTASTLPCPLLSHITEFNTETSSHSICSRNECPLLIGNKQTTLLPSLVATSKC
jgi:hypothetical protein